MIIDLPYHKRWWLPDGRHQLNSVIYGNEIRFSVIEAMTLSTRQSITFQLTNKDGTETEWKSLGETFVALAEWKYRKVTRAEREQLDYARSYRK